MAHQSYCNYIGYRFCARVVSLSGTLWVPLVGVPAAPGSCGRNLGSFRGLVVPNEKSSAGEVAWPGAKYRPKMVKKERERET